MRYRLIPRFSIAAMVLVVASMAEAANCKFDTVPTSISFGTYSPFGMTPTDSDMSFSVRCSAKTEVRVELSPGRSLTYAARTMTNAQNPALQYNLYTQSDRSVVFGDGKSGTAAFVDIIDPKDVKLPLISVWGRIPPGMDVGYGIVTDEIFVMLYEDGHLAATVPISVTAEVLGQCTVESFNLNFGEYDPVSANAETPLTATTFIRAFCTSGTRATISLNQGANYAGGTRRMSGSGDFLAYDIFTEGGHMNVWDTTAELSSTSKTVPLGGPGGLPAYGKIPKGQNVRAGNYTDTVVATVNY